MNKETAKSLLRAVLQILGVVTVFSADIPILGSLADAIEYVLAEFDGIALAVDAIVGFVLVLIGFFYDSGRFEARKVVAKLKGKAALKGMTVKEYLG